MRFFCYDTQGVYNRKASLTSIRKKFTLAMNQEKHHPLLGRHFAEDQILIGLEKKYPNAEPPFVGLKPEDTSPAEKYLAAINKLFVKVAQGNGDARMGFGLRGSDRWNTFRDVKSFDSGNLIRLGVGGVLVKPGEKELYVDMNLVLYRTFVGGDGGTGRTQVFLEFDEENPYKISQTDVLKDIENGMTDDERRSLISGYMWMYSRQARPTEEPEHPFALFRFIGGSPAVVDRTEFSFSKHGILSVRLYINNSKLGNLRPRETGVW